MTSRIDGEFKSAGAVEGVVFGLLAVFHVPRYAAGGLFCPAVVKVDIVGLGGGAMRSFEKEEEEEREKEGGCHHGC